MLAQRLFGLGKTLTWKETQCLKFSQHGDCRGSSVRHHGSGVCGRCAEDQGRMRDDRHEVGCGHQERKEVKPNNKTQARNV